jgi:hypothetical protein
VIQQELTMPVTVRLDEDTRKTLQRIARDLKISRSEVIRRGIGMVAREAGYDHEARPLIEILGPLVGSVRTGRSNLSEETGRRVREKLAQDRRE